MKPQDQKRIVKETCKGIEALVCGQIDAGKIPEEWDGHELRRLIADLADERWASISLCSHPGKRRREYENTRMINNI